MSRRLPAAFRAGLPFALFYAAAFGGLGVFVPFWPLVLEARGVEGAALGTAMALGTWARAAGSPLAGHLADRLRRRRDMIVALAVTAAGAAVAAWATDAVVPLLAAHLVVFATFPAVIPLGETQAMSAVVARGLDYGRLRLWGSLAFIGGVLGVGALIDARGPTLVPLAMLAAFLGIALAAPALPHADRPRDRRPRAPLRDLLADRTFLAFLVGGACLQASHAVYYAYSAVHWKAAGLSAGTVSWLWSEGVLAEVLLFSLAGSAVARFGPRGLLVMAAGGGLVRWSVLAASTSVPVLAAVQWLHALTFGAAHLGAMYFIARHAPPGLQATAQGTYAAASGGLAMGAMSLAGGGLYDLAPWTAFGASAALSAVGGAVVLARVPQPHPTWA